MDSRALKGLMPTLGAHRTPDQGHLPPVGPRSPRLSPGGTHVRCSAAASRVRRPCERWQRTSRGDECTDLLAIHGSSGHFKGAGWVWEPLQAVPSSLPPPRKSSARAVGHVGMAREHYVPIENSCLCVRTVVKRALAFLDAVRHQRPTRSVIAGQVHTRQTRLVNWRRARSTPAVSGAVALGKARWALGSVQRHNLTDLAATSPWPQDSSVRARGWPQAWG